MKTKFNATKCLFFLYEFCCRREKKSVCLQKWTKTQRLTAALLKGTDSTNIHFFQLSAVGLFLHILFLMVQRAS